MISTEPSPVEMPGFVLTCTGKDKIEVLCFVTLPDDDPLRLKPGI